MDLRRISQEFKQNKNPFRGFCDIQYSGVTFNKSYLNQPPTKLPTRLKNPAFLTSGAFGRSSPPTGRAGIVELAVVEPRSSRSPFIIPGRIGIPCVPTSIIAFATIAVPETFPFTITASPTTILETVVVALFFKTGAFEASTVKETVDVATVLFLASRRTVIDSIVKLVPLTAVTFPAVIGPPSRPKSKTPPGFPSAPIRAGLVEEAIRPSRRISVEEAIRPSRRISVEDALRALSPCRMPSPRGATFRMPGLFAPFSAANAGAVEDTASTAPSANAIYACFFVMYFDYLVGECGISLRTYTNVLYDRS